jgi:hypothetical protein
MAFRSRAFLQQSAKFLVSRNARRPQPNANFIEQQGLQPFAIDGAEQPVFAVADVIALDFDGALSTVPKTFMSPFRETMKVPLLCTIF